MSRAESVSTPGRKHHLGGGFYKHYISQQWMEGQGVKEADMSDEVQRRCIANCRPLQAAWADPIYQNSAAEGLHFARWSLRI